MRYLCPWVSCFSSFCSCCSYKKRLYVRMGSWRYLPDFNELLLLECLVVETNTVHVIVIIWLSVFPFNTSLLLLAIILIIIEIDCTASSFCFGVFIFLITLTNWKSKLSNCFPNNHDLIKLAYFSLTFSFRVTPLAVPPGSGYIFGTKRFQDLS